VAQGEPRRRAGERMGELVAIVLPDGVVYARAVQFVVV
jgi:hypothetical protein